MMVRILTERSNQKLKHKVSSTLIDGLVIAATSPGFPNLAKVHRKKAETITELLVVVASVRT